MTPERMREIAQRLKDIVEPEFMWRFKFVAEIESIADELRAAAGPEPAPEPQFAHHSIAARQREAKAQWVTDQNDAARAAGLITEE